MTNHDFNPASDKQKALLRQNGYSEEGLEKMSKSEAYKVISTIISGVPKTPTNNITVLSPQEPKDVTGSYPSERVAPVYKPIERDRLIVRQSSMDRACFLRANVEQFKDSDIFVLAEAIEGWVFR